MLGNASSEVELLQASLKGNTTAFEAIVKRYQSFICAITFSATGFVPGKNEIVLGEPVRLDVSGDIFDITATFRLGDAKVLGLDIGGNRIEYHAERGQLQDAPLKPVDGKITIRALIDRPMMEIIGNHGRVYITRPREIKGKVETIEAFASGGTAKLVQIEVNELESIWKVNKGK